MFRKVHRASYEAVCVNGVPQVYDTEAEAEIAAWRALRSHLCGDIVGDGQRASGAKSKAEEMFGSVFRRGRKIEVVRR